MTEALTNQSFIALALLTATSLVAGFFAYLYNLKRRPYLLYWAFGWAIVALSYVAPVLSPRLETVAIQTALNGLLHAVRASSSFWARNFMHNANSGGYMQRGLVARWCFRQGQALSVGSTFP